LGKVKGGGKMGSDSDKKTLLIVDDVELFIQLQITHLGRKRFDIHTANNGSRGLDLARSIKPDLILLDLLMPDMNGDQVCRILKGDPETSSIPVLLVSSGTREHSRSIIDSSGCDGLIYKPVRRDLLLSVVENLLKTNHRIFERVDATIPCTVVLEEKEYIATIRSLSTNGVFIEFDQKVVRGDMLGLTFTLPVLDSEIHVRTAAAVWCGTLKDDGPTGVGVQFLTIDPDLRKQIGEYANSNIGRDSVTAVDAD
jgi:CheY-like chemotaxis protein/Tfp pilus assembly protein PilZ